MEKQLERTLAIIKPDGMKNMVPIIEMIYENGLRIIKCKVEKLDKEIIKEHYAHLLDKPFYPELESYMTSDRVALMILEGDNAVEKFRTLMGPTDSRLASPNTIRGKYGIDKSTNAVHGSDSLENAEIEINRFFNRKPVKEREVTKQLILKK